MTKNPCDAARSGWWVRVRRSRQAERDLERSGKWLLYIHCRYVERVWSRVIVDVRAGLLGPAAKVSTHKPSPQRRSVGQHVICVYTESFEDRDDLLRVAKRLVTTAELKRMRISYKSDAQTLSGQYQGSSPEGVAMYGFGPPYQELVVPKPKQRRESGWDDFTWAEDDSFYIWPYGPE